MRRLTAVAVAVVAAASLSACNEAPNTDPRKGRVTLEQTNCLWDTCVNDWKVCADTTLIIHITGVDLRYIDHSAECAA
jgi:hypothetical protein